MNDLILLLDILKYGIIIIILLGLTAAILSPFVILNDQSLIADGLSHVSFMAIAVGLFFSEEPFYVAAIIVVVASILIKWLSKKEGIKGDIALGMVSSLGIAMGFIVLKYSKSFVNIESLISGNLWLRQKVDVYLALFIFILSVVFVIVFYRKLLSLSFDYGYAKFKGVNRNLLDYLFSVIIGLFVVIGVRSVGILLISSLLIFPAVISNIFAKSFKDLFIYGTIITLVAVISGIIFAHILDLSAGSVIVLIYSFIFIVFHIFKGLEKKKIQ